MFHVKSGTARLFQKCLDHIRINWRICSIYSSGSLLCSRYSSAVNLQTRNKPHQAIMARYMSFIKLEILNIARLLWFLFISSRSDIFILFDDVLYFFLIYRTNMIPVCCPFGNNVAASMSNNIPREESNPTRVQCHLACYSVAFHRWPPALISQLPFVDVFHDFIVINLCDFLFLLCARDFPRGSRRVTPPHLASTGWGRRG